MGSGAAVDEVPIETGQALEGFLNRFRGDSVPLPCSVDTEADSLHSHKEKLCLIQLSCGGEHRLIDPLVIDDLSPLITFLDERAVWLHGADFDMSLLRRTFGWIPATVYDTQIAARLVGHHRFGLAHLVEDLVGIKLSKHSQRADWGKRPLPPKMVSYALDDVRYVLRIADILVERLKKLGRYEWFEQSCEGGRQLVLNRPGRSEDKVWRIGGSGKLNCRGLAYLRELWKWRDHEAMLGDKPAFRVTANQLLIELAGRFASGGRAEPPRRLPERVKDRFRAAVVRADELPEAEWPEKVRGVRQKRDPKFKDRFTQLQTTRDGLASTLDIDETLIASKSTLEKLAVEPSAETIEGLLLPWQRDLMFGEARAES